MKKILLVLLCCLLLVGCAAEEPEAAPTTSIAISTTQPAKATGYYDPDSGPEAATGGAVRCYPLTDIACNDMLVLDGNIVLISLEETGANLTLLTGEEGIPTAGLHVNTRLSSGSESLHPWDGGISFYEDGIGQTLVIDNSLRTVSSLKAPEGLLGSPILSTDRTTLYYCTANSIRALELETGISRCLREISYPCQELSGLWIHDTVLECTISDDRGCQTLFLSTETGEILYSLRDDPLFRANGDRYFACLTDRSVLTYLYGNAQLQPMLLQPRKQDAACIFLPEDNAAVTMYGAGSTQITLEYYDLDSGLCTASLTLETDTYPRAFCSDQDGRVCFLNDDETYGCPVLYKWDTSGTPVSDETCYTDLYYTPENPDVEGLAQCQAYAEQIGAHYGIEVLIHKDATAVEPYDYNLEAEHLVGVLQRELALLEQNLSRYPEGFLSTLASRFDGFTICICRSLTGTAEAGSPDSADGIQFLDGYHAYVALSAAGNTEYALFHELCHLIDTVVISESGAYDRWEELNPKGFAYDYDYAANANRDGSAYLQAQNRSFIDTYSMSFPKEDRARIMEYAMTEGNADYFRSTTMQAKLKLLCEGIREAFGLRKSPETFPWEQYLNISLAYTGK